MGDYLLWYAKKRDRLKSKPLYEEQDTDLAKMGGIWLLNQNGDYRGVSKKEFETSKPIPNCRIYVPDNLQSQGSANEPQPYVYNKKKYEPGANNHWKPNYPTGLDRLSKAGRLHEAKSSIRYRRFIDDFPLQARGNLWTDTLTGSFTEAKQYVVQTNPKVIERCLLLTTDPGDLVLDPTCGSGTTAYVAEKWGRRWITCDTSRIAVTLTKQRLMTASYDYFTLRHAPEGLRGGFSYKSVPHIMLKSIANNPDIDSIYDDFHPIIEAALSNLNASLKGTSEFAPIRGARKGKKIKVGSGEPMMEWEVPATWPEEWPDQTKMAFEAFHNARHTMQRKMDASIADHAEPETLYDKPEVDLNKLRITGPFSVEAVPNPTVFSLDRSQSSSDENIAVARSGETSRQNLWRDELLRTGIRGKGGQILYLTELETIPGLKHVHASGTFKGSGERVLVSFGPEHAALEQRQVP